MQKTLHDSEKHTAKNNFFFLKREILFPSFGILQSSGVYQENKIEQPRVVRQLLLRNVKVPSVQGRSFRVSCSALE